MKLYIGEQIKALRKEKKITQEKLADIIGVSYQSVSRWESGVCYPDIELLPTIANYFGVSIDKLLSNDVDFKEIDQKHFYEKLNTMKFASLEQLQFAEEYYHKYPDNDCYAFTLQDIIKNYILNNKEQTTNYLPTMVKLYDRLKGTSFYEGAVGNIICVCPEEELEQWLYLCAWTSSYTYRGCLISRYNVNSEWEKEHLHIGIEAFENLAAQLDRRFSDALGPTEKAKYHRGILQIIASFGDGVTAPDGWALFYAYKQFVLAACLFGDGKLDEGWTEFDLAFATYRRIFALDEEWLSLGNPIFSNLKIRKDYTAMQDSEGNEYPIHSTQYICFCSADFVYKFLTNRKWAWFDIVRNTPKYQEAVNWAKETSKRETHN